MDSVLVGYGDHERNDATVRWASLFATMTGAPMTVVSVVSDFSTERQPGEEDEAEPDARRRQLKEVLADTGAVEAAIDVRQGDPVATLIDMADEHPESILVVGSHEDADNDDPGGFGHHLLQQSHHAVAVVPDTYEPLEGGKLVVGVDGTEANTAALRWAEQLAKESHGSITAVFAYEPLDDTFVLPHGWHRHSDAVHAEVHRIRSVPVNLVMEPGDADDLLVQVAKREHAAAIVVGTRGHMNLGGHVTGRVPVHVLHNGACPTIAVPG